MKLNQNSLSKPLMQRGGMAGGQVRSDSFGASGNADEQEYIRLRYQQGGRQNAPNLADLYDRTGNMRVARTLAHYQNGGGIDFSTHSDLLEIAPGEYISRGLATPEQMQSANQLAASTQQKQRPIDARSPVNVSLQQRGPNIDVGQAPSVGAGLPPTQLQLASAGNALNVAGAGATPDTSAASEQEAASDPSWWQQNQGQIGETLTDTASGLLNIAPNLANIRDLQRLPGIAAPQLGRVARLQTPSDAATRQAIIAQGRTAQQQAGFDTAQSGSQAAARAAAMAGTQSALSRQRGQQAQVEAQIANQQAAMDQQQQARNLASVNQYYKDVTERDLAQIRGIGAERQAISQKLLGSIGDQRQRKLDKQRLALTQMRFQQEGALKRAIQEAAAAGDNQTAMELSKQLGYT